MKNKLADLNNHLFAQLERLSDEDLTPEQIDTESRRGLAIVAVADQIIRNASVQIQAAQIAAKGGADPVPYLPAPGPNAMRAISVVPPAESNSDIEETRGEARRRAEARERGDWANAEHQQALTEALDIDNTAVAMRVFGLTKTEAAVLLLLLPGKAMSREAIHDALYHLSQDAPEIKIVDVFISKIRAKLDVKQVSIETVQSVGYLLSPVMADRVRSLMGLRFLAQEEVA